ncbi:MAG: PAS domain S-box protein, partial [Candidatus Omnitrophota bacterium]
MIISFFLTGLALAAIIALGVVAKLNIVLLLIIVPVIAGLIGFFISKAISEPVQELYRKAKIVHPGTMAQEVGAESTDEVGRLSMEFDSIAEDLKKTRVSLEETGKESAEHKKIIQELRDREEHFRRLFEQSNDAVFIYDFEGRILDVNNRACDMLGYSKVELLKIPFLELQTEEELTKSKRAYKTGTDTCSLRLESKFKKSNGKVIDVEISSSCVDLKKGIMQGIVSNITERKELEAALKESEEKFRTFMETASDLMFISDKSDNLIYVNEAMVNTLGYSREEMIGLHITDILSKESLKDYNEHKRQLASKGEVIYEPVWETKNRIEIEGEIRVVAIYDSEGRFAGSRGIFRDISERKKVERSQRLAQLGKLAADVAHEVNNPVSIICGNAELGMMDYPGDEKLKKTFETIVGQCEQANNIVKRLLMFSKPSKHDFMEKDVNEAIQVVVNLISTHFLHGG